MKLSGAQILIEEFVGNGVDVLFGYPGGAVLDIYDELYRNTHRIRHVTTAHEQGAAFAADGYARASGKIGVVLATSGPGATNLVTGIANAYLDSIPLVAITGNVAVPLLGRDSFQEVDIIGITQPIVKHSFLVRDIHKLAKSLQEAFSIANTGRKGPVLVDIPKSIQREICEYQRVSSETAVHYADDPQNIKRAVQMLLESRRPYLYCGGGVVSAGAESELVELSQRIAAPIGCSMMGLSAVVSSYPLNLGMCGMHGRYAASVAQAKADLIIAVGVRFSDRATGDRDQFLPNAKVLHIDVDVSEIGKNIHTDFSLCGDLRENLQCLLKALPKIRHSEWLKEIRVLQEEYHEEMGEGLTPKRIIELVQEHSVPDCLVATDVGQHQMWVMQHFRFQRPRTLLTSGGLGAMGYGLGAAIGGCIASQKQTVLFTGDGSFGMNLNELATAVSQRLPILIIVFNNGVLGMVRQWQAMFYGGRYAQTTLDRSNYAAIARAFGAEGYTADTPDQLIKILQCDRPADRPCLIDCRISREERVLPMIPPGGSIQDIIVK